MIGSFWNLCRACPSMPVDKLHSEYRSTYRWHEFTGNSRPEIVRRPPIPNQTSFGPINEPPLPRRKKCPELAYKSHEFIIGSELRSDSRNDVVVNRARSEERGTTPSRRSKSEGPPAVPNGRAHPIASELHGAGIGNSTVQAATLHELEPLVNNVEERKPAEKLVTIVEKKSTRPFSQTFDHDRNNHFITKRENFGFEKEKSTVIEDVADNKNTVVANGHCNEQWYRDVIELRKKAGEYKSRGWGKEIHPELYKKQKDLWDQVSKRSSLSALSLATSVHSKPRVPGQAHLVDNKDETILPSRFNTVRHHLERTTGPDVEEGALLPSPTREKLMPAITKRESESQRGSPKKSATSRHGSPQKGSPQKARSQSVGPGFENESPKRQMRSASTAPAASKSGKKTPVSTPTTANAITVERKPRPSTLSTSIQSRSKSSSLPPSGRAHSVPANHHIQLSQNDTNKTSQPILNLNRKNTNTTNIKTSKQTRPKSTANNRLGLNLNDNKNIANKILFSKGQDNKLAEYEGEEKDSSSSPHPVPEVSEPIVKSPPEPTRVKSPEQIIMRSPDPVNWTVPLDTGKTFTVTQNVKEGLFLGETYSRPQSEIKASTPVDRPPPAPQSAPPELTQQIKMDAWKNSDLSDPKSSLLSSPTGGNMKMNTFGPQQQQRYDKPIPGTTIRCLDDPSFNSDSLSTSSSVNTARNTATDVLEKARDRFDRFWGGNKEDNV